MQRFGVGDNVLVLPKFGHLYPANGGVVAGVQLDPFHAMFNEYTIRFADGSSAGIFEFQLLENDLECTTQMAVALAFDSPPRSPITGMRGPVQERRIILQTDDFDIDIKLRVNRFGASLIGQLLGRETTDLVKHSEIRLMKDNVSFATATSDGVGAFMFQVIPRGSLNILINVPGRSLRILGALSV
jgi:hypothetical protein